MNILNMHYLKTSKQMKEILINERKRERKKEREKERERKKEE